MTDSITMPTLKSMLRFPLETPERRNRFLVGAALTFAGAIVPIVPLLFVGGYAVRTLRQAVRGEALEMPPWDRWGELALDGVRAAAIGLIYMLPSLVVFTVGWGLYFSAIFLAPLSAISRGTPPPVLNPNWMLESWLFSGIVALFIGSALGFVLLLLGAIPLPPALAHFAARDKFGAAFHLRTVSRLVWRNKLGWFLAWAVSAGVAYLLSLTVSLAYLTVVLCFALPLLWGLIGFYTALVSAVLFGRTYRETVAAEMPEP